MSKLTWKDWIGVSVIASVVAVVVFLGLLQFQHWRLDEANVHGMVQLLNYNVAQGRLLALPEPTTTPPKPVEPPKP